MTPAATLVNAARNCVALRHAHGLAEWVGAGKPVTAKGVLRRADLPSAGDLLEIDLPDHVRSAADVPALHRPWTVALRLGLLSVANGRAVPGPALASWTSATNDEWLDRWLHALVAALAATFDDDKAEALEIGRLALTVLATNPPSAKADLPDSITRAVYASGSSLFQKFAYGFGYRDPAAIVLEDLSALGAVKGLRVTTLGRWALQEISSRGASLIDRPPAEVELPDGAICQLKIALRHMRPPCWRRVLVPATATLGTLHDIIQIALAWDNDHLHAFTVGQVRYGDPAFDIGRDEEDVTLAHVFAGPTKKISYVYDFGDSWQHEITLERTLAADPSETYPVCVGGRSESPVEDWGEDDPESIPFDQEEINAQLSVLAHDDAQVESQVREVIKVILIDAYGEAEQSTAFLTVLEEEIDFPVPAELMGNSVIVTKLDQDERSLELRARCKGQRGGGDIPFADLTFRDGTVEAWLQAAYLTYLGRPVAATPPRDWSGLDNWRP